MAINIAAVVAAITSVLLMGCSRSLAYGLLYTETVTPLTIKMDNTPVGVRSGELAAKSLSDPSGTVPVRIDWGSRAPGDIAKQAELEELYYLDLRTTSYLAGLWRRQTVIVHGR